MTVLDIEAENPATDDEADVEEAVDDDATDVVVVDDAIKDDSVDIIAVGVVFAGTLLNDAIFCDVSVASALFWTTMTDPTVARVNWAGAAIITAWLTACANEAGQSQRQLLQLTAVDPGDPAGIAPDAPDSPPTSEAADIGTTA